MILQSSVQNCQNFANECASSPLLNAVLWIQQLILGSLAQTIATIGVATIGFLMLTGRFDWKRGIQVIIGCFIVFGATSIANGIMSYIKSVPYNSNNIYLR